MIKYPAPLKKGDTIGICAPSSGVFEPFIGKLDCAKSFLEGEGYNLLESESVRRNVKMVSAPAEVRAKEFMDLYLDERIGAIIPPWGGEFLMDMLPLLDFELLAKALPKWILGFSDLSTLLFVLTLKLGVATAHGPNLLDFGSSPVDRSALEALEILQCAPGESYMQQSFPLYQKIWPQPRGGSYPGYNLTERVEWKIFGGAGEARVEGRLLGGCLDVLCKLVGTPFAGVESFINDYEAEGIVWYFESCEMKATDLYRTLWQMKMAGWFRSCKGVLFGRPQGYLDVLDFRMNDIFEQLFSDLELPVIYDIDLGHLPPQLTFINGAYATVTMSRGKGEVKQELC